MSRPVITHHPYLGIELSSDLSWDLHVATITKKDNQTLTLLFINLGNCPVKVKEQAYFTLVRPYLEFPCSAWDPHLPKHILEIVNIQRRGVRGVKSCYIREPGGVITCLDITSEEEVKC